VSDAGDQTGERSPIEQAVEHAFDLFVYAPIGILFEGASLLPELVAKGKSQVAMARVIGTFAVDKAQSTVGGLSAKLQDQTAGVIDFIGDSITPVAPDLPDPEPPAPAPAEASTPPRAVAKEATKAVAGAGSAIRAASLAIPDYDGLSASQVVNRLAGLSPAELTNVQQYEAAHRGRKTILSKVAQLQAR
jgi:hypothetical protein